ncbi:MAG: hypothetical protein QME25_09655, partial [Bacteroidota bacterium]|nr:hypothetical protein [Bacteroidota bacterium]
MESVNELSGDTLDTRFFSRGIRHSPSADGLFGIPFSLYYGDNDVIPILLSSGISVIFGFGIWLTLRKANQELGVS